MKQCKHISDQGAAADKYSHYQGKGVKLCEVAIPVCELLPAVDGIMPSAAGNGWKTPDQWVELSESERNRRTLEKDGWERDSDGQWHFPYNNETENRTGKEEE